MPAGYSSRCKVCNSQHRVQIEKWAKEDGLSARVISAKLKEEYGEEISYKSIWQHLNEHFDVKAEVREQYRKSQEQYQKVVEKRLSDLEMLDATIADNYELSQATTAWLKDLIEKRRKIPLSLVQLREKLQSEMRQAIKQKLELTGDDPLNNVADALRLLWSDDDVDAESEGVAK
jgi:ATP-dependent Lon protease